VTPYRWVDAGKAEDFPVATACAVAHVTRSAYYDWLDRSSGPTEVEWDEASWSVRLHNSSGMFTRSSMRCSICLNSLCHEFQRADSANPGHIRVSKIPGRFSLKSCSPAFVMVISSPVAHSSLVPTSSALAFLAPRQLSETICSDTIVPNPRHDEYDKRTR